MFRKATITILIDGALDDEHAAQVTWDAVRLLDGKVGMDNVIFMHPIVERID